MKRFKHSGTHGDLIYSLSVMKYLGGGEFYLHLNQIEWIVQHYYNSQVDTFHRGRMSQEDFNFMRSFLAAQSFINAVDIMQNDTEITHNLDRFRPLFVGHPGNYIDIYCHAFGILDAAERNAIRTTPWLTVPTPRIIKGKNHIINRTARWITSEINPVWALLKEKGTDESSVFIGLPQEYDAFKEATGWNIDYYPTPTMLDMAEVIAGSEQFIGNQSLGLSLAIGLGVPYACEVRRDLSIESNECYFHNQPGGLYF